MSTKVIVEQSALESGSLFIELDDSHSELVSGGRRRHRRPKRRRAPRINIQDVNIVVTANSGNGRNNGGNFIVVGDGNRL